MGDYTDDQIEREFGSIIDGLDLHEPGAVGAELRPALRVERLRAGDAVPLGGRARFLMTSYDGDGRLAVYGWRTDLRIQASGRTDVPGLHEPGVHLVDECDWYTTSERQGVWVDISRVWVEQLALLDEMPSPGPSAWLQGIVENHNAPVLESLHQVPGRHHLTGARVVYDRGDGTLEHDLRAAAPALMGDDGTLVVPVVTERHWYRWTDHEYGRDYRPVRALPAARLWVE
ncbi:hypothetical protein [Intrasporangium sp.]|uniref:hypothetical protein n=1 Tax=Intrasporangium sp. TaxID=1925024 RepID=UPI003221A07E